MFRVEKRARVYVALGITDMRKGAQSLAILVESEMGRNLFNGDLFVFSNRRRNTIKVLYWSINGFAVWMKKLDSDQFRWPKDEGEVRELKRHELGWLLEGLDIGQAHDKRSYKRVV